VPYGSREANRRGLHTHSSETQQSWSQHGGASGDMAHCSTPSGDHGSVLGLACAVLLPALLRSHWVTYVTMSATTEGHSAMPVVLPCEAAAGGGGLLLPQGTVPTKLFHGKPWRPTIWLYGTRSTQVQHSKACGAPQEGCAGVGDR
jgi:hypothetical protein